MTKTNKTAAKTSAAAASDNAQNVETLRATLLAASAARVDYERSRDCDSAAKKVESYTASLNHEKILSAALALGVDFAFVNRHIRSNQRFNIYAFEKVAKLLRHISKVASADKHTLAVLRNAAALREAIEKDAFEYTRSAVKSTVSANYRDESSKQVSALKFRNLVSASTASTQASSTIEALEVLRVVKIAKASDMKQDKLVFDFNHVAFDLIK